MKNEFIKQMKINIIMNLFDLVRRKYLKIFKESLKLMNYFKFILSNILKFKENLLN
jgi:hypothetical protein